ncbi:MAG: FprA family A-type flavoprotein [Rikenellaceae bacterium]
MLFSQKLSDGIYMLRANDRRTQLFENHIPLPSGVAYNCYIINDEKTALFDTIHSSFGDELLDTIKQVIGDKSLDYLVIHHLEPDHSGEIKSVIAQYPSVEIYGNKKTFEILKSYLGEVANLVEIKDGDTLELGEHSLQFVLTPWIHWPETMMTFETKTSTLFSADAFGSFGAVDGALMDEQLTSIKDIEDEMLRYYSNIVGKYSMMVSKALTKLSAMDIKRICPVHGVVWSKYITELLSLYQKWSAQSVDGGVVIAFASMYGFNESMADYIAISLANRGVKGVKVFDVSKSDPSYILTEVWRSRVVLLGSCAYNGGVFTSMETLCNILSHCAVKGKSWGIFGTGSWNGGGVKGLVAIAEGNKWECVSEPVEIIGKPNIEKLKVADALIEAVISAL